MFFFHMKKAKLVYGIKVRVRYLGFFGMKIFKKDK